MARKPKLPFTLYLRGEVFHARFSFIHGDERIQFVETTRKRELSEAQKYCVSRVADFKASSTREATLDAVFGRYYEERGMRQASAYNLKKRLAGIMSAIGPGTVFSRLSANDVIRYKTARLRMGIAPATINRALTDLIAIQNAAREWGYVVPDLRISKLKEKVPETEIDYFTKEEMDKILAAASPHMRDIILAALYTGFRKSNILGLRVSDIDFELKTVSVRQKGDRCLTIPMIEPLERLIKSRASQDYVFTFEGAPIKDIKRAWKTALKNAGVRHRPFHTLRHTTATWMLAAGAPMPSISKVLGHASINTTMRFYSRVLDDGKRAALDAVFTQNPLQGGKHVL